MKKETREQIDELTSEYLKKLRESTTLGTNESEKLVDDVSKLIRISQEDDKIERENKARFEKEQKEDAFKYEQIKREKRDAWIKNGLAIAGCVFTGIGCIVPIVLDAAFINRGFVLEETGSYTSKTLGRLLNRFGKKR
jgi:hypothetical protein